jgi:uracil-DNA glycosylase family 4
LHESASGFLRLDLSAFQTQNRILNVFLAERFLIIPSRNHHVKNFWCCALTFRFSLVNVTATSKLIRLQNKITRCRLCPRLVSWREHVAREKVRRFAEEEYWGKPVPSIGDANARLLIIGLAPAAHGGNRTGRMFTGDRSGDWLYRSLHEFGFANQPTSEYRDDGLQLRDCFITATCRCAPPQNKPDRREMQNCRPYLLQEIKLLKNARVVVALGKIGFDAALSVFSEVYSHENSPKPQFAHGAEYPLASRLTLIASFHPSQQNTFTGKLTKAMFDAIFRRARTVIQGEERLE